MYAIIETGGKQYRVQKGDLIDVELLKEDSIEVEFKNVLLFHNGKATQVGVPYVQNALVKGEVLGEVKGPKEISFKYKRRKGIRHKAGHRQKYCRVEIKEIIG